MTPEQSTSDAASPAASLSTLINDSSIGQEPTAEQVAERAAQHATFAAEQQQARQKEIVQWRQESENDPELGGVNLGASVTRARAVLQQLDPDNTVSQWLDATGLGNHVSVLRFFNRVAKAFGTDTVAVGRPASSGLSLEERMYPNWKP